MSSADASATTAPATGATRPEIAYQRALVFKRWYPDSSRGVSELAFPDDDQLVNTHPFETDDDKVHFVQHMMHSPKDFEEFFDYGCLRRTRTSVCKRVSGELIVTPSDSLQFYQIAITGDLVDDVPHDTGDRGWHDEYDDMVSVSLTFPVGTRAQQLEFARWIEAKRFGDFLQSNTHVYFSNIVTVAEAPRAQSAEKGALRAVADALFEHKEAMPEATYLAVSNAMKRSHAQI